MLILADDRTLPILEGAKRAFAEKGFDGASMQDLARAADMSAGNFYRYFPSKNAIIEAIIAQDLATIKADFLKIMESQHPLVDLTAAFQTRIDDMRCSNDGPLWAEIDAAAARRPEIAEKVRAMEAVVHGYLLSVFVRLSGLSAEVASERFSGHAAFLVLLFKAATHQPAQKDCQMPEQLRNDLRGLILTTIARTLGDVTQPATLNIIEKTI